MLSWLIQDAFAGMWATIWQWGLGIGMLIICLVLAYVSPIGRKDCLLAAVAIAIALIAMEIGRRQEHAHYAAQQALVSRTVKAAVKKAEGPGTKKWRDPWDRKNY